MSKYIGNLGKINQENDIPQIRIKENKDLFFHFHYANFNNLLFIFKFPKDPKKANVMPVHRKKTKQILTPINQ